jgi:hypothetical protein
MADTWGQLNPDIREAIRPRLETIGDDELESRIRRDEQGEVRFRLFGGVAGVGGEEALRGEEYALGPPPPAEVVLIPPEDFDYDVEITDDDKARAAPIDERAAGLQEYFRRDPGFEEVERSAAPDAVLPAVVDHRPLQSPVKHQQKRGTCVSHASMGLLEAAPHIPDDLSEQYTHWRFCEITGRPQDQDSGFRTTDAAGWLAREDSRVCLEENWPYIPTQEQVNDLVHAGGYGPPPEALADLTFGYTTYKLIGDTGIDGESIKNTRYLESLLALGFDIVIGTWVSWRDEENRDVLRPILDSNGQPVGQGGHAMLVVGYDRPGQYFIVKNSWGLGWGHAGYAYFHYDYIRTCFKYGFTVSVVEPPAPVAA